MAWTEITRRKYRRDGLRYASNLTDAEWALIQPLLPSASPLGRPRETELRSVVNAILYMHPRLPVAAIAERVSAVFDGARLFLCLVAHRRVRQHQSPSGHGGAREGGTEKQARPPASSTANR